MDINKIQAEYGEILEDIFLEAFRANTFHFLATILRFDGMFFGHWDPLEESKETFADLEELLKIADKNGNRKREIKLALLTYCHAIEMTQVHQIMANLLRICAGKPFKFRALWDEKFMKSRRKSKSLFFKPPSLGNKARQLKALAQEAKKSKIDKIFDEIFNFRVRNAFSHSDYCIDLEKNVFRYVEGGPSQEIKLETLDELLNKTFVFFNEFFRILESWHYEAAKMPRFHKFQKYEVLELLVDNGRLFGFCIHYSNGSKSTFERQPNKVNNCNFEILDEGIGVFVGELSALKKGWHIRGIEVVDFKALNEKMRVREKLLKMF